ncbi:MAG: hypothetical protein IT356_08725 [Gemmatimonadaceae bacterium]|nr:hypothetical protein [Gemmatimonadaceae bacterium]
MTSIAASILLHAIIAFLILGPVIAHDMIVSRNEGAGGKGPAGGGGGGRRGGGPERALYIEVAPPPPAAAQERQTPQVPQPVVAPQPVVKPPELKPELPTAEPLPTAVSKLPGTGSGAGTGGDGAGSGTGTGGGVGSGSGTGTGSGNGPGTGGGSSRVYPPSVTNLALLPLPVPAKVRPYTLVAVFEVDEKGNARLLHFNESRDAGYNRKIRAMLDEVRFRPAVRADGTPVKDTTSITASAPA